MLQQQEKYTKLVEECREQKEKYEKQLAEMKKNFNQVKHENSLLLEFRPFLAFRIETTRRSSM